MILVDLNGIIFQNIFGSIAYAKPEIQENGKYNVNDFIQVTEAFILDQLFNIQNDFQYKYGSMVLCLDNTHSGNWRREYYPHYKEKRSSDRERSEIPFSDVFDKLNKLIEQLSINTPYKVVSVDTAEGDDVILCLAREFSADEPVLIISSDKDMIQAQQYGDVKQYSLLTKKWITPELKGGSMEFWLHEHVILGDSADGVPKITNNTTFSEPFEKYLKSKNLDYTPKTYNMLTYEEQDQIESDFEVLDNKGKKRVWCNPRFGVASVKKILENNELDEFLDSNPLYRENFERNKRLVLDDYIPRDIYNKCVSNFLDAKTDSNTEEFVDFLTNNGLGSLITSLPLNFVNRLDGLDF